MIRLTLRQHGLAHMESSECGEYVTWTDFEAVHIENSLLREEIQYLRQLLYQVEICPMCGESMHHDGNGAREWWDCKLFCDRETIPRAKEEQLNHNTSF